jgi:hypothetical protein
MKKVLVKMKLAYNKLTHGKLAYELRTERALPPGRQ